MALINCPECSTKVSDQATSCPSCGYPIAKSREHARDAPSSRAGSANNAPPPTATVRRSRAVYIILGLVFGGLGFHNFYSGHKAAGAIKVGVFLIAFALDAVTGFYTGFFFLALLVFYLWSLVEVITVKSDADGTPMS
jgi:TM2 domain-containing membrane protein YozV